MMKQAVFTITSLLLLLNTCSSQAETGLKPKLSVKVQKKKPKVAKKTKRKKPPPKKIYPPYSIHDPKIKKELKYILTRVFYTQDTSEGTEYGSGADSATPIGPGSGFDDIIEWFKAHEAIAYPAIKKRIKDGNYNLNHIMLFSGLVKEKDIPLLVMALESAFEGFLDERTIIGMEWYRITKFIMNNLAEHSSPKGYEAVLKLMYSRVEYVAYIAVYAVDDRKDIRAINPLKQLIQSKNRAIKRNAKIMLKDLLNLKNKASKNE